MNDESQQPLSRLAGVALWSLPVWSLLLALSTLTHQPDPETDFRSFADYVTTDQFLVSHIFASILGAGLGTIGLFALFWTLALRRLTWLSIAALLAAVLGNTLTTSIFGVAAFGQPAMGEMYLEGDPAPAEEVYDKVYAAPLFATAGAGLILLTLGIVMYGISVARSGSYPKWAGIIFAVGGVLFAVIGFLFVEILQPVGAALMMVSTAVIALHGNKPMSSG